MRVRLKNKIYGTTKVKYVRKGELTAYKCDNCGIVFDMNKYCNDRLEPSLLSGTF